MELERRGASPKVREMNKKSFDVDAFLNTVDGGKSVANYQKNRRVFAQGDAAIRSFTSKRVKSKSASYQR